MNRLRRRLVMLAALAVPLASSHAQQARFRSVSDAVLVDVQVTHRGRPVTGLTVEDFELRDSNVRQTIRLAEFTDVPISLLLALDVSSSLEGEPIVHLKRAASAAVNALRPTDQAALLTFAEGISLRADWTRDRRRLEAAIAGVRAQGWTSLHDAILAAIALRENADGRVVLLIFTDGADTTSWLDPLAVVDAAQRSDLVVMVVSSAPQPAIANLGDAQRRARLSAALRRWFDADPSLFPYVLLDRLAEETGGEVLYARRDRDLSQAFERVVASFKTRYLLTYVPTDVSPSGWHPIAVKLTRRAGEVRARRGYWR